MEFQKYKWDDNNKSGTYLLLSLIMSFDYKITHSQVGKLGIISKIRNKM